VYRARDPRLNRDVAIKVSAADFSERFERETENRLYSPHFSPAELTQVHSVFDDPGFIYELKHEGFRAITHIEGSACQLVSRRVNVYKSFAPLRDSLRCSTARS